MSNLFEQQVLPLFEVHRGNYLEHARRVAFDLARHHPGGITINHVRAKCPPPSDIDPRVMGAVFARSHWERVGYESSDRRECHGRPVAIFRPKVSKGATP